jgi:hypothetical protein
VDHVNNDAARGGSIRDHHIVKQNCGNNHKVKRDKNKASSHLRCPQRQTTFSPTINRLVETNLFTKSLSKFFTKFLDKFFEISSTIFVSITLPTLHPKKTNGWS